MFDQINSAWVTIRNLFHKHKNVMIIQNFWLVVYVLPFSYFSLILSLPDEKKKKQKKQRRGQQKTKPALKPAYAGQMVLSGLSWM